MANATTTRPAGLRAHVAPRLTRTLVITDDQVLSTLQRITVQMVNCHHGGDNMVSPPSG